MLIHLIKQPFCASSPVRPDRRTYASRISPPRLSYRKQVICLAWKCHGGRQHQQCHQGRFSSVPCHRCCVCWFRFWCWRKYRVEAADAGPVHTDLWPTSWPLIFAWSCGMYRCCWPVMKERECRWSDVDYARLSSSSWSCLTSLLWLRSIGMIFSRSIN